MCVFLLLEIDQNHSNHFPISCNPTVGQLAVWFGSGPLPYMEVGCKGKETILWIFIPLCLFRLVWFTLPGLEDSWCPHGVFHRDLHGVCLLWVRRVMPCLFPETKHMPWLCLCELIVWEMVPVLCHTINCKPIGGNVCTNGNCLWHVYLTFPLISILSSNIHWSIAVILIFSTVCVDTLFRL